MTQELTVIPRPQSVTEAMRMAEMISKSSFAPKGMAGKPGDILLAWQLGSELGLSLMQALQNIAVINGKPALYGDAALAVVQNHPHYIAHREWFDGDIGKGTRTAHCAITRRGSIEHVVSFSMEDAKKAALWGKAGPWTQYPDRMLQMRARGFAIRDKFSDALRGIITREEAEDYQQPVQTPTITALPEPEFDFSGIEACTTLDELRALYTELKDQCKDHPDHYKLLNRMTHDQRKYLEEKDKQNDEPVPTDSAVSAADGQG